VESRRPRTAGKNKDEKLEATIEALSCHIKLLNYFAMQRSFRLEFLRTSITEDIIRVLQDGVSIDKHEVIRNSKLDFIGQCLTLLFNLALDKQILQMMLTKNLSKTCLKLRRINDKVIQFTAQILLITLDKKFLNDLRETHSLSKTCVEYLNKSIKASQLCHHGIKLSCLLENLKSM
jgi:hypothetical protein